MEKQAEVVGPPTVVRCSQRLAACGDAVPFAFAALPLYVHRRARGERSLLTRGSRGRQAAHGRKVREPERSALRARPPRSVRRKTHERRWIDTSHHLAASRLTCVPAAITLQGSSSKPEGGFGFRLPVVLYVFVVISLGTSPARLH